MKFAVNKFEFEIPISYVIAFYSRHFRSKLNNIITDGRIVLHSL